MSSWRDDFDFEPGTHPAVKYAMQARSWPFPTQPHYTDRTPPPTYDSPPKPDNRRDPSDPA